MLTTRSLNQSYDWPQIEHIILWISDVSVNFNIYPISTDLRQLIRLKTYSLWSSSVLSVPGIGDSTPGSVITFPEINLSVQYIWRLTTLNGFVLSPYGGKALKQTRTLTPWKNSEHSIFIFTSLLP